MRDSRNRMVICIITVVVLITNMIAYAGTVTAGEKATENIEERVVGLAAEMVNSISNILDDMATIAANPSEENIQKANEKIEEIEKKIYDSLTDEGKLAIDRYYKKEEIFHERLEKVD